jgi:hydrogenase maturation protease
MEAPMIAPPTTVTVLVCGSLDRGDDAAALRAVELLRPESRRQARIEVVGQLGVEQLVDRMPGGTVIVVDAAVGIAPGRVVRMSFADLRSGARSPVPRSSHELPIPEVVAIAELIGGPLLGGLVVIGGLDFSLGASCSPQVRDALPELAHQIEHAIDEFAAGTHEETRTAVEAAR